MPSVFPNCPKYLTKPLKQRRPPLIRNTLNKNTNHKVGNVMEYLPQNKKSVFHGVALGDNDSTCNSVNTFSFLNLQKDVKSIVFPNGWSRYDISGKLIMFSYYTIKTEKLENINDIPTPILLKRVCLGNNLNVKCFVMKHKQFGSSKICCNKDLEELKTKI